MSTEIPIFIEPNSAINAETTLEAEDLFRFIQAGKTERVRHGLSDIQDFLSKSDLRAKLPKELIENLGMNNLTWQMIHIPYKPNNLPYLFLGGNLSSNKHDYIEFGNALATIYVHREIIDNRFASPVLDVRIAGIEKNSNRAIAVKYGANANIHGIDLVAPELDAFLEKNELLSVYQGENREVEDVSNVFASFSKSSGLITSAMIKKMNAENDYRYRKMDKILMIKSPLYRSGSVGFYGVGEDDNVPENTYFYYKFAGKEFTVFHNLHGKNGWKICVPASLDQTLTKRASNSIRRFMEGLKWEIGYLP